MALTIEQLRAELLTQEANINKNIEKAIDALAVKVDNNALLIGTEREERRTQMENLQSQINNLSANPNSTVPASGPRPRPGFISRSDDLYNKYQRARRSLLIFPVKGDGLDQILPELQRFCCNSLLIPRGEIQRDQIELVRRFRGTKLSRGRHEIIVLFSDNDTRDYVLSHARNLASKLDHGVRIDVPPHLQGIKRTLDEYGYMLKNDVGDGFKRNVRYEDSSESLVMDVFYPDAKNWERISYSQALDGLAESKRNLPIEEIDQNMESAPVVPADLASGSRSAAAAGAAAASTSSSSSSAAPNFGDVWRAMSAALITETWLTKNVTSNARSEDLEYGENISLIRKDRGGRKGGGVALSLIHI